MPALQLLGYSASVLREDSSATQPGPGAAARSSSFSWASSTAEPGP